MPIIFRTLFHDASSSPLGAPRSPGLRSRLSTALALLPLALLPLGACSSDDDPTPSNGTDAATARDASVADAASGDATSAADAQTVIIGGDRPVELFVPTGYDSSTPMPLLLSLHGFTSSGAAQEDYLDIAVHAESRGFLYAYPDGTRNRDGLRFWNATDACCDFYDTGVDDSGYLRQVIADIQKSYSVDPNRIFLIGHSNGGFMSHRMACDHADVIAAIVSLAGAQVADTAQCQPSEPVSVLQIHGDADETILFAGGNIFDTPYPSAQGTAEAWAGLNGCELTQTTDTTPLDLDSSLVGAETSVVRYETGCNPGGHAELWTIAGGAHVPMVTSEFVPAVLDFLFAHPKSE